MGDQVPVLDYLGKVIAAGQTIVYPGRHGSNMWLNKALVISVNHDASLTVVTECKVRKKVVRTDRVAIVE